jgi:hypothetical protein
MELRLELARVELKYNFKYFLICILYQVKAEEREAEPTSKREVVEKQIGAAKLKHNI